MYPIEDTAGFCQGRRILDAAQTPYILTKSGEEADRLNLQHWLLKTYLGSNTFAPVKRPLTVLDVACGTGVWGREVGRHWKQTQVVENIDLDRKWLDTAQRNLKAGTIPASFHFTQGNILERLPYVTGTFNYVHARFLIAVVPLSAWPRLVAEMARVTTPGGWVELVEADLPSGGGPAYAARLAAGRAFMLSKLESLDAPRQLETWLKAAGLEAINYMMQPLRIPVEETALRQALLEDTMKALRGIAPYLGAAGLLSEAQQREDDLPLVQQELEQTGLTSTIYIAFGRKPRHFDG